MTYTTTLKALREQDACVDGYNQLAYYLKGEPCIQLEDGVVWAEDCEPEFFGVYIGEPGDFKWLADFQHKAHAEYFAHYVAGDEHTVEYPE